MKLNVAPILFTAQDLIETQGAHLMRPFFVVMEGIEISNLFGVYVSSQTHVLLFFWPHFL